jgi:xanthine dehydrogenase YagS FAD-binding subunit
MVPFAFERARDIGGAVKSGSSDGAAFLAGGTTLVDLMKLEVLKPARLIDVSGLDLSRIEVTRRGVRIGALATNTDIAQNPELKQQFPVISEALLAGASPQLRNVATLGGNLLQRTRCAYYRDLATSCNKRNPGSGCAALEGWTRMHAILGTSEHCIAAHPSDLCVALAALEAVIRVEGPGGKRELPFEQLHLLPGDHPEREFSLKRAELITSVFVPATALAAHSRYVKVRDRQSYAFALASCAAAVELKGNTVNEVRIAIGGVGTRPWRCFDAEKALRGQRVGREAFEHAAELALAGAKTRPDNAFKAPLGRRTVVRALSLAAETR